MSEIGVGFVGCGFMGRAYSNAYRQVARFFCADPVPRMRVLCGRDEEAVRSAADALGWEGYETDYARIHTVKDLLDGIVTGDTPAPTFEDGYRCQAVIDAGETCRLRDEVNTA